MKTSDIHKKLKLDKMTVAVLRNPEVISGGNGANAGETKTARTATITSITDTDTGS